MQILKQSTAVDVLIGPFVDATDGYTAEEGLTPSVLLSKNGQALAAANDGDCTHDDAGYYNCELDATDTNTVGTLVLIVESDGTALPVRHEFQVVEEAVYDMLFVASATGYIADQAVNVTKWGGTAVASANVLIDGAITADKIADNAIDAATFASDVDAEIATMVWNAKTASYGSSGDFGTVVKDWLDGGRLDAILDELTSQGDTNETKLDTIITDTNELQTDWTNGGRLDAILDELTTQGDTNEAAIDSVLSTASDTYLTVASSGAVVSAASVRNAIGMAAADLDDQLAAIVEDTGTTIPATITTIDTLLDRMAPALIGTVTGAGTGTEVFVYGGVTATYTVDEDGNRSEVAFS